MRSIDHRLKNHPRLVPRRPLSSGFTDNVMGAIHHPHTRHSHESGNLNLLRRIVASLSRFRTRHGMAALVAIVVAIVGMTAGTGFAALQWLMPHNTVRPDTVTVLPNGNTRFLIHFDSCQGQGGQSDPSESYYEIKAGSSMTPEKLSKGLEGSCENLAVDTFFPQIVQGTKQHPAVFKPYSRQYFIPDVQVESIAPTDITVNTMLNGVKYRSVTLPLDKSAKAFTKGKPMATQDIKSGDWVALIVYTEALSEPFATETMYPGALEKLSKSGFPIGARVEGFVKRVASPMDTNDMWRGMGTDWTRLVKDDTSPGGLRPIMPLQ